MCNVRVTAKAKTHFPVKYTVKHFWEKYRFLNQQSAGVTENVNNKCAVGYSGSARSLCVFMRTRTRTQPCIFIGQHYNTKTGHTRAPPKLAPASENLNVLLSQLFFLSSLLLLVFFLIVLYITLNIRLFGPAPLRGPFFLARYRSGAPFKGTGHWLHERWNRKCPKLYVR